MALAKLWNAVFGKRTSPEESAALTTAPSTTVTAAIGSAKASKVVGQRPVAATSSAPEVSQPAAPVIKLSRKKTKGSRPKAEKETAPVQELEPAPIVRMFRKKTNAWTKLIGNREITSVLDINVGDGSRALEILEAIVDGRQPAPKYIAIGMFDLDGKGLTVREFHRKTRVVGGQPMVIPMPLAEGLKRLAETVGTVDLVLLSGDEERLVDPMVAKLLNRISSNGALVLHGDTAGRWKASALPAPSQSRRAA